MKYADIKATDVANGLGIRVSLFVSGCRHQCKGCFNSVAWDFDYGTEYTEDTKKEILKLLDRNFIKGISLLGGEPLEPENQKDICDLIVEIKNKYLNKDIWLYTGFTYEEIVCKMYNKYPYIKTIIESIDILVDGKFEEDKKDLTLKFRGSSNQRIIDIKETIKANKIIQLD